MDASLAWLRNRQRNAEAILVRNDAQRRNRYCRYENERPMTSSKPRTRRLSDFQGLHTSYPRVPGTAILEIPAEVRNPIWEHAFCGKLIALYRDQQLR
jgi:hypothetical protein